MESGTMDRSITHIGERATIPTGRIRPVPRRGEGGRAFDPEHGEDDDAATDREAAEGEVERPQLGERDEDEAGGLLDLTA